MAHPRLLLVDDDPAFLDSFRELLCDDGYDVEVARDGREGLEKARQGRPDLIVLDLRMPIMGGDRFLTAAGADPGLSAVPVLLFTAFDEDQGRRAVPVFEKPLGLRRLLSEIRRLASGPRRAA
jgi:CheY-like chemotaxis protein